MKQLSAKDKAFLVEKQKYQRQVRNLQTSLQMKDREISDLTAENTRLQAIIDTYAKETSVNPEELAQHIERTKRVNKSLAFVGLLTGGCV